MPGLVGVVSMAMGRYREFDLCLSQTVIPEGSERTIAISNDNAFNYNRLCRRVLENKKWEWLWMLDDDHTFKPDILTNLLARNVDIVSPLCTYRRPPYQPLIYTIIPNVRKEDMHWNEHYEFLSGKSGMIEVGATGNAGRLIRRHVIEKIAEDWHRTGWICPDKGSSDLYFCKRARDAGFKIHVDLDNPMGHITHMAVWPIRNPDGVWNVGIGDAMEMPDKDTVIE